MPTDRWDWWNDAAEADAARDTRATWSPRDDFPTAAELADDDVPTRPPVRRPGPPFDAVVRARQDEGRTA